MARIITSEELAKLTGQAPAPVQPAPAKMDWGRTLLELLQNPLIQDILRRLLSRVLPPPPERGAAPSAPSAPVLTPEKVVGVLEMALSALPPEMTVGQVREELQRNREQYLDILRRILGANP